MWEKVVAMVMYIKGVFLCVEVGLAAFSFSYAHNELQAISPPPAMPTITNILEFTQGSPSSTLTCTSTTSIATTVTFLREGNAINGIMRDGDSATVNGVTYQLSQTLTNRIQSTYDNVLTINEPLSSLAGSTFTCQVENALGMSAISDSFQIPCKTCGLGMYTYN